MPSVPKKKDTDKQFRPRSDAAACGVLSVPTLFESSTGISIKHGDNKIYSDTPSIGMDLSKKLRKESPLGINGLMSYSTVIRYSGAAKSKKKKKKKE